MGGCVGKPSNNKVNPPASDGQFIHGELQAHNHSKNHKKSEAKILSLETTKNTSIDTEIVRSSGINVENHDQNSEAKTMKMRSEMSKNTSTDNDIMHSGCSVVQHKDSEQNNFHISSQGKAGLPPKAVRFDIDLEITSQSTARKFPRRLKKLEGMPQLTAEQLRKKQELAEHNRAKELQRKTETLSKHNRDLFQARECERIKNAQIQMEQKFLTNERNRQIHMKGVIKKQREREKKAKKVREKSYVELEGSVVHVDETYSSDGNSQDENWGAEQEDERSGAQDEDSTDEFYETSTRRSHLYSVHNSTNGFVFL